MDEFVKQQLELIESFTANERKNIARDFDEIITREYKSKKPHQYKALSFDYQNPQVHIINHKQHEKSVNVIARFLRTKEKAFNSTTHKTRRIWRGCILHNAIVVSADSLSSQKTLSLVLDNFAIIYAQVKPFGRCSHVSKSEEEFKQSIKKIGKYFLENHQLILIDIDGNLFI